MCTWLLYWPKKVGRLLEQWPAGLVKIQIRRPLGAAPGLPRIKLSNERLMRSRNHSDTMWVDTRRG